MSQEYYDPVGEELTDHAIALEKIESDLFFNCDKFGKIKECKSFRQKHNILVLILPLAMKIGILRWTASIIKFGQSSSSIRIIISGFIFEKIRLTANEKSSGN